MCVCVYIYVYTYTCIYSYTHTYMYLYIYTHIYLCIYIFQVSIPYVFFCLYICILYISRARRYQLPSAPGRVGRAGSAGTREGNWGHPTRAQRTMMCKRCWAQHNPPTWCESRCLSTRRPPGTPSQPTARRQQGNCCTCRPRSRDGNLS